MKTVRTVLVLVVVLLIANTAGAAKKKKDVSKDAGIPYFQQIDRTLKPVTLTDEQKSKLEDLKKEYGPKLKEAYAKQDVLTPEQKKARDNARKAAKADGKKGEDVKAAGDAAVTLTDDQKKQEKEAHKQLHAVQKELHGKVMDLLTAEQKAQIDAAKEKSDKPAKAAKPAKETKPAADAKAPAAN